MALCLREGLGDSEGHRQGKVNVARSCPTLMPLHGLSMEFSRPEYWSG